MPVKKEGHLCLNEAFCTGWDKHKRRGCPPATLVSTHSLPEAHLVATGPACFLISFRHLPDQLRYCPPSYYSKVWVMPDSCCPGLEELCLRGDRAGNALSAQMLVILQPFSPEKRSVLLPNPHACSYLLPGFFSALADSGQLLSHWTLSLALISVFKLFLP